MPTPAITLAKYTTLVRDYCDSVTDTDDTYCWCRPGSNDGYTLAAFGKVYRMASVECPRLAADLFKQIVSFGPIELA